MIQENQFNHLMPEINLIISLGPIIHQLKIYKIQKNKKRYWIQKIMII